METSPVSKFKATCHAVVRRVERSGRPVLITHFGQPIAEVLPLRRRPRGTAWLGSMQGSVEVLGDEHALALTTKRRKALVD